MLPPVPQTNIPLPESVLFSMSDPTQLEVVPEIQQLLLQYSQLFQEPSSLPPERYCDHHIELVPGAQLVNTRAYRYAPTQKTKIEK